MRSILYTKFFKEEIKEPVNVILSPEFYWIKKIDIPIKSLKDAKKIAKTQFKLDEKKYIFDAIELNGKFYALAFEKDLKLNIPQKFINSIRIAQVEFFDYECVKIDQNHSIRKIDDLLFCFPQSGDCKSAEEILKEIKLSNKKFNLINRLEIDKSILISSVLIFILLNSAIILKIFSLKKELTSIQNQKDKILSEYKLPKTSFELNSILQNLKTEYQKQVKIKKDLEFITKTPLNKGDFFQKLSFDKTYEVVIKTSKNLDGYFKKRFEILNSSYQNGIYKASMK